MAVATISPTTTISSSSSPSMGSKGLTHQQMLKLLLNEMNEFRQLMHIIPIITGYLHYQRLLIAHELQSNNQQHHQHDESRDRPPPKRLLRMIAFSPLIHYIDYGNDKKATTTIITDEKQNDTNDNNDNNTSTTIVVDGDDNGTCSSHADVEMRKPQQQVDVLGEVGKQWRGSLGHAIIHHRHHSHPSASSSSPADDHHRSHDLNGHIVYGRHRGESPELISFDITTGKENIMSAPQLTDYYKCSATIIDNHYVAFGGFGMVNDSMHFTEYHGKSVAYNPLKNTWLTSNEIMPSLASVSSAAGLIVCSTVTSTGLWIRCIQHDNNLHCYNMATRKHTHWSIPSSNIQQEAEVVVNHNKNNNATRPKRPNAMVAWKKKQQTKNISSSSSSLLSSRRSTKEGMTTTTITTTKEDDRASSHVLYEDHDYLIFINRDIDKPFRVMDINNMICYQLSTVLPSMISDKVISEQIYIVDHQYLVLILVTKSSGHRSSPTFWYATLDESPLHQYQHQQMTAAADDDYSGGVNGSSSNGINGVITEWKMCASFSEGYMNVVGVLDSF
jgi:hypothetical protein